MNMCPSCKVKYDDDKKFCRKCGETLLPQRETTPEVIAKRDVFEAKIAQEPGNIQTLVGYGDYLVSIQMYDEALIQYFKVLELDSSTGNIRTRIINVFRKMKRYDQAATHLLILLESHPEDLKLLGELVEIYLANERLSEAADTLSKMSSIQPGNTAYLLRRLDILRKLENEQELSELCKNIHQLMPYRNPICSLYVGIQQHNASLMSDSENLKEADKLLNHALSDTGSLNDYEKQIVHLYLCSTMLRMNTATDNIKQDLDHIKDDELSKEQVSLLGECYLMLGNSQFNATAIDDAIDSYMSSLDLSDTSSVRFQLAKCYEVKGDVFADSRKYGDACHVYRKGLKYDEDYSELIQKLKAAESKKNRKTIIYSVFFSGVFVFAAFIAYFIHYGQGSFDIKTNLSGRINLLNGSEVVGANDGVRLTTALLRYGSYKLRIEREGYETINQFIKPNFGRGVKEISIILKPVYGTIKVASDPARAKVVVRNKYEERTCTTPCELKELFSMQSSIEITLSDYVPFRIEKAVPISSILDLGTVTFKGGLKFDSDPPGAEVFINDEPRGRTPVSLDNLPAKRTKVEARKKGAGLFISTIGIEPAKEVDLGTVKLSNLAAVRVDSDPIGAKIYLDRKQVGNTPAVLTDLDVGNHSVRLEYSDCSPFEKSVTLQGGEVMDLGKVSFFGAIKIASDPSNVEVFINGEKKGVTPITISNLLAKDFKIKLQQGEREYSESVRVQPMKTTDLGTLKLALPLTGVWKGNWKCSNNCNNCETYIVFDPSRKQITEDVFWCPGNLNVYVVQNGTFDKNENDISIRHNNARSQLLSNNYNPDFRNLRISSTNMTGKSGDSKNPIEHPFSAFRVVPGNESGVLINTTWLGQAYNHSIFRLSIRSLSNVSVEVIQGSKRATIQGQITKSEGTYTFRGSVTNSSGFGNYNPDDITFSFTPDGFHIQGSARDMKNNQSGSFRAVRIS